MDPIVDADLEITEEDLRDSYSLNGVQSFPNDGYFKESFEYYQTLFKFSPANFLFPLSDQLICAFEDEDSVQNNQATIHPTSIGLSHQVDQAESEEDNQAEQNEFNIFDVSNTFETLKKSKTHENITVKVQRKVTEFVQISGIDKLEIKYNDLVILFGTKTKTIFKGIWSFINQEDCDEKENTKRSYQSKQNQTPKQKLVEQKAVIQFEDNKIFTLKNFSTLSSIRSRQYRFSISSCIQALKQESEIGSIDFSNLTLNSKPATNFLNYSKINMESYKEAIQIKIAKLTYLTK